MDFAVVTILNRGFLSRADVLFSSLGRFHPNTPRFALMVDSWSDKRPRPTGFEMLTLQEAGLVDRKRLFRFTRFERLLTFKALAMKTALERAPKAKLVLFLDADMMVLNPLTPIVESMVDKDVMLSPHLLEAESNLPQQRQLNRVGVFNAGLLGATREGGRPFLEWYEGRLKQDCLFDSGQNLFHEQKWLDLVPSLFDGTVICRHPGANVAYWNREERALERGPDGLLARGKPLLFFHFSGWSQAEPGRLSGHLGGRLVPERQSLLSELLEEYHRKVSESPFADLAGEPSVYDFYYSGERISDLDSIIYGELLEAQLPEGYDPYQGLPARWQVRLIRLFELTLRGVPWNRDSVRHLPGLKTLVQLLRKFKVRG